MKIYTKTGDKGKTSLYDGTRVDKNSNRVEAYGTVDELNAALGIAKNYMEDRDMFEIVETIQHKLFNVGGELATTKGENFPDRIVEADIEYLESVIDAYILKMGANQEFQFILPGSNHISAHLHLARTICRRAERRIVTLSEHDEIAETLVKYINRLSDAIYALARYSETHQELIHFKK
ncbi:MAG: cob(I)yrinic acid a,c-diamide adenosyltransferase [Clostridia bacterium]|nr:cob(I)yrinic acid a,c-diamide adenosyltransferase [Clostridia bacterium]